MNQFPIGLEVEYNGVMYKIIDIIEKKDKCGDIYDYLYDLQELEGDGVLDGIQEKSLSEILSTANVSPEKKLAFVVTAFGVLIPTEVHFAYTGEEAERIRNELFSDFQMESTDAEEMSYDLWVGYSKNAQCDIHLQIHELEITPSLITLPIPS